MDIETRVAAWLQRTPNKELLPVALGELVDDEDPVLVLAVHAWLVRRLDEARPRLVLAARDAGASWADVGAALGMTKQGAWDLYRSLEAGGEVEPGPAGGP